jgi:hypothetical protein cdiviTM7_02629
MLLLKNIFATMSSMKNTSGFTLVEIIIVICVIGIISTVTLVSYSKLRENSYDAAAKETLHQVETAFKAYVAGGNKVPLRHYKNIGFYDSPGGGSMDLGIKVFSGGGIGLAMHKANYLPDDLLNTLKNGPTKDTDLKNNIGYKECGKNKVFFYIEVYNGGIEQRELRSKMDTLRCSQKTDTDWLAEHGITRHAGGWGSGDFTVQPRYLVAEVDFDNESLDSD